MNAPVIFHAEFVAAMVHFYTVPKGMGILWEHPFAHVALGVIQAIGWLDAHQNVAGYYYGDDAVSAAGFDVVIPQHGRDL